jgi:hypothetical protein
MNENLLESESVLSSLRTNELEFKSKRETHNEIVEVDVDIDNGGIDGSEEDVLYDGCGWGSG